MNTSVTCTPHEWSILKIDGISKLVFFDQSSDSEVVITLRHLPMLAKSLEEIGLQNEEFAL